MRNLKKTLIFCTYNLHVSHLNKHVKEFIVVHIEQEILLFNFCSINFQTIFYSLFLLILKCFQTVFKAFLGCFIVLYEMFTTTLQKLWSQWADQSMTFSISPVKSHWQVWSKWGLLFRTLKYFQVYYMWYKKLMYHVCLPLGITTLFLGVFHLL